MHLSSTSRCHHEVGGLRVTCNVWCAPSSHPPCRCRPQTCMRQDRLAAYEGLAMNLNDALANEMDRGMQSLASREAHAGAARFSSGAGRHGTVVRPSGAVTTGTSDAGGAAHVRRLHSVASVAASPPMGSAEIAGDTSALSRRRAFDAVVFDLGGVLLDSPFPAIAAYERELGLDAGAITAAIGLSGDSVSTTSRAISRRHRQPGCTRQETSHSALLFTVLCCLLCVCPLHAVRRRGRFKGWSAVN